MSFKHHIINNCLAHLSQKVNDLITIIREVNEAGNLESKSSAGDKHETAKAMAQLEQEKLGNQLKEAEMQLAEFKKHDLTKSSHKVEQGSLVETDKGYFFIAASIGKLMVDEKTVFVISNRSPLALHLTGLKTDDTANFNGVAYHILNVQ
jgi:transcription elongation GreA/GreB family factor